MRRKSLMTLLAATLCAALAAAAVGIQEWNLLQEKQKVDVRMRR